MTDREAADRKANEIIPPRCILFNEDQPWIRDQISIAIQEAVIAERLRCAKIADELAIQSRDHAARGYPNEADATAETIAERIRTGD